MKVNKKIIFSIIGVLIIIAIGSGYWWTHRKIYAMREDYVFVEKPEGKFIENEKAGLIVKVPEGWSWHIIGFEDATLYFESPDIEGKQRYDIKIPPYTKGCGIEMGIFYERTDLDELIEIVKEVDVRAGTRSSELEITTINNRKAVRNIFESSNTGPSMGVYFIQGRKIVASVVNAAPDDKERCFQELYKFLETVSIE